MIQLLFVQTDLSVHVSVGEIPDDEDVGDGDEILGVGRDSDAERGERVAFKRILQRPAWSVHTVVHGNQSVDAQTLCVALTNQLPNLEEQGTKERDILSNQLGRKRTVSNAQSISASEQKHNFCGVNTDLFIRRQQRQQTPDDLRPDHLRLLGQHGRRQHERVRQDLHVFVVVMRQRVLEI